ncbi:hypothetical protein LTR37_000326 [Vermiconidia calcicola]|uniref:Uncharacterized protein n=1 Tax=Vermiconidia calcicola TaxID=1690605 RepID=A0ACC3NYM4_9PEZI|nr:hypothetical protein LTR37_000326 [Vermiconidia calcicola]
MDKSPFARLAGELRNEIWALAVKRDITHSIDAANTTLEPPLTRTCKQVRLECQLYVYTENDFDVSFICPGKRNLLNRWVRVLGPTRLSHVQSLTVNCYNPQCSTFQLPSFFGNKDARPGVLTVMKDTGTGTGTGRDKMQEWWKREVKGYKQVFKKDV